MVSPGALKPTVGDGVTHLIYRYCLYYIPQEETERASDTCAGTVCGCGRC